MKNSPLARKFLSVRKERMYHHHHHGNPHLKHHEKDHHHGQLMGHDHRRKLKWRHHHEMKHKLGHHQGMIHKMGHHHGMKHGMRHHHGMEHRMGHRGMKHLLKYKNVNMHKGDDHETRDYSESDDDHCELHDRGHDLKQKKHFRGMKHDMKKKMIHSHGIKFGFGFELDNPRMRFEHGERINDSDQGECSAEENCNETCKTSTSKTNAQVTKENNKFQISLDISYYQPEKVTVEIMDGKINVSAIHESLEDDLYEFHEMYRSFNIPADVNPIHITSQLNEDGKLIIEAPICVAEENNLNEREVLITS